MKRSLGITLCEVCPNEATLCEDISGFKIRCIQNFFETVYKEEDIPIISHYFCSSHCQRSFYDGECRRDENNLMYSRRRYYLNLFIPRLLVYRLMINDEIVSDISNMIITSVFESMFNSLNLSSIASLKDSRFMIGPNNTLFNYGRFLPILNEYKRNSFFASFPIYNIISIKISSYCLVVQTTRDVQFFSLTKTTPPVSQPFNNVMDISISLHNIYILLSDNTVHVFNVHTFLCERIRDHDNLPPLLRIFITPHYSTTFLSMNHTHFDEYANALARNLKDLRYTTITYSSESQEDDIFIDTINIENVYHNSLNDITIPNIKMLGYSYILSYDGTLLFLTKKGANDSKRRFIPIPIEGKITEFFEGEYSIIIKKEDGTIWERFLNLVIVNGLKRRQFILKRIEFLPPLVKQERDAKRLH